MTSKRKGGGDFMSSHRTSVLLQRLPGGLSGRRVQEAKELYAPKPSFEAAALDHALAERGNTGGGITEDSHGAGDVLVRRAERRVGKKALVLKAKLGEASCKAGEAVRIKVRVKNRTAKVVSVIKVHLTERELENGTSVKRKCVVEEYMMGGVFPMDGEGEYTGHLSYAIPPDTRPSNQWRTHDLWVGLKVKGSIPSKMWVSFPLQVTMEGQLLDDNFKPTGRTSFTSPTGRASVVGVMSDPALTSARLSLSSSSSFTTPSPASSTSGRRRSLRGSAWNTIGHTDLAAPGPMHMSADSATLRGTQTIAKRDSRFNRLSRTLSLTITKGWFGKEDELQLKP